MSNERNTALSKDYFTKEFPQGWEVEWKGNLFTHDPSGFIFQLYEIVSEGKLSPYKLSSSLGSLPLNIRVFDYIFHFYGHKEQNVWIEDFVLAQPHETDVFIPRIKKSVPIQRFESLNSNVIIRLEKQKEDLKNKFSGNLIKGFVDEFETKNNIKTELVGTIKRERHSFYITNMESNRNWGILADRSILISSPKKNVLSQVEFEYKGRNGISYTNLLSQTEAIQEMDNLGSELTIKTGVDRLIPTRLTKFEWITSLL